MKDWKVSSKKSLRQGHKLVSQALRDLGCRGVDLAAWTVKEPLYTAALLRYKISSFWLDSTGKLWKHNFIKMELTRAEGQRIWTRRINKKGLVYLMRLTVYKTGDCKVDMVIGVEEAPI